MLSRPGRLLGLLLLLLLDFVKVLRWCNLCFCCRIMRDIVVELWDGEQKIASKQYKHPLTAAELKTALAQENKDWTGTLQQAGSSIVSERWTEASGWSFTPLSITNFKQKQALSRRFVVHTCCESCFLQCLEGMSMVSVFACPDPVCQCRRDHECRRGAKAIYLRMG